MERDAPEDGEPTTEALERALIAGAPREADDGGLDAWLRHEGAASGKTPSIPTVEAFVLYRRWAESVGAVPLAPFDFARQMLGRFDKRVTSMKVAPGRYRAVPCYLLNARAARRLRAQAADHPAADADRALFTFKALREARHPSRKET